MKHIFILGSALLCLFAPSFVWASEYTIETFTAPNKYVKEVLGDAFHLSEAELFIEVLDGSTIIYRTKGQDILGEKDLYYFNEKFSSNKNTLLFNVKVGIKKKEERIYRAGAGAGAGGAVGAAIGATITGLLTGGLGAPAGAAIGAAIGGSAGAGGSGMMAITDAHTINS